MGSEGFFVCQSCLNCRLILVLLAALAVGLMSARTPSLAQTDSAQEGYVASLPNRGAAPELQSAAWLNSDQPLRLAILRGKVVLVEFWTFGCINCIRTLPYVQGWHETYQDQGLVVVGMHFPEFNHERDLQNVVAAA